MIRGLPDYLLFPYNNKVWHGTVALHFCFLYDGARFIITAHSF
jgi:hypothetical protein